MQGDEGGAGGARKRIRLEKEAGALPEINMDECGAVLNVVLPFFYNDEDDYESQPFNDINIMDAPPWRATICRIARFFDKFDLRSGKTALIFNLPYVHLLSRPDNSLMRSSSEQSQRPTRTRGSSWQKFTQTVMSRTTGTRSHST